ncbi:hypothetical protein Bca52824_053501 [Brassica carinata]|uniref:Uncharacterized protein n=1 Tax=Brassica carinata TaxID=52824 RepID=A0A8X7R5T3_BRACI|nr:hypothetical protein Bca52824_053501 [Brassica carinata]
MSRDGPFCFFEWYVGELEGPMVIMIRGMVCAVPIIILSGSCASSSVFQFGVEATARPNSFNL